MMASSWQDSYSFWARTEEGLCSLHRIYDVTWSGPWLLAFPTHPCSLNPLSVFPPGLGAVRRFKESRGSRLWEALGTLCPLYLASCSPFPRAPSPGPLTRTL